MPRRQCPTCKKVFTSLLNHWEQRPSCDLPLTLPPALASTESEVVEMTINASPPDSPPQSPNQQEVGWDPSNDDHSQQPEQEKLPTIIRRTRRAAPPILSPDDIQDDDYEPDSELGDFISPFSCHLVLEEEQHYEHLPLDQSSPHVLCVNQTFPGPADHSSILAQATPQAATQFTDNTACTTLGNLQFNMGLGQCQKVSMVEQLQYDISGISDEDRFLATFHHKCQQAGAPRYLSEELLRLVSDESLKGNIDFTAPEFNVTRKPVLKRLQEVMQTEPVEEIPITLESGFKTTIYRLNFLDMITRHLRGSLFANLHDISLPIKDGHNPFADMAAIPEACDYKDLTDGHWYQEAVKMYLDLLKTGKYKLHPWIIYGDKTGTDRIEKNSLEPFAICSAELTIEKRGDADSWMLLGYIPNLKTVHKEASKSTTTNSRSMTPRDYHHCLAILLQPLKDLQKERPMLAFRRGEYIAHYKIIAPVMAVIGDNLSNDVLSQRMLDNTESAKRLSRRCFCLPSEADKPIHKCHLIQLWMIRKLSLGSLSVTYGRQDDPAESAPFNLNHLQNLIVESQNFGRWKTYLDNQGRSNNSRHDAVSVKKNRAAICDAILKEVFGTHSLLNAFDGCDHGPTVNGILEQTRVDIMHTIDEGAIPMLLEVLFGLMSDGDRSKIDAYVNYAFGRPGTNRSGETDRYPRIAFRQGFTKLTNLSASERFGQLFLVSILLQTNRGVELLQPRFQDDFDINRMKETSSNDTFCDQQLNHRDESSSIGPNTDADNTLNARPSPNASTKKATDKLPWDEITAFLTSIQLDYVHERIYPSLPLHHQALLVTVLQKMIKRNWVERAQRFPDLPNLDYITYSLNNLPVPPSSVVTSTLTPTPKMLDKFWTPNVPNQYVSSKKLKGIPVRRSISLDLAEFRYLVETLIALRSCVKDTSWLAGEDGSKLEANCQQFMLSLSLFLKTLVHGVWRGKKSMGWKLRKIVELSHLLQDIIQCGSADGTNSSTGERLLKWIAKLPSKTVQQRSSETHSGQTAARFHEMLLLKQVVGAFEWLSQYWMPKPEQPISPPINEGSAKNSVSASVPFVLNSVTGEVFLSSDTRFSKPMIVAPVSPTVLSWFKDAQRCNQIGGLIHIQTEAKVDGELCRAHANYSRGGVWFDYVALQTATSGEVAFPCRIAAIYADATIPGPVEWKALLHCAAQPKAASLVQKDSCSQLFSHWTLESRPKRLRDRKNEIIIYHEALFQVFSLEDLAVRIYCVDICSDSFGDCFIRKAIHDRPRSYDILWTGRDGWAETFLSSPNFLRSTSATTGTKKDRKRKSRGPR
ncbi:unnamed protein product [Cylindrotheca closterium]|uniref:Uncharacterized protein n=1 Tax=Cylindrotheca closterium TaxID=2856 RepID=A0AAD2FS93_9STRA|nr:unnamed protein product [Cylindrotheca closterium]